MIFLSQLRNSEIKKESGIWQVKQSGRSLKP
jgi:hypothetical protein